MICGGKKAPREVVNKMSKYSRRSRETTNSIGVKRKAEAKPSDPRSAA